MLYASKDEVTPVTLVSFEAAREGSNAVLNWEVSESSPAQSGFHVYRSSEGTLRERITDLPLSGHTQYRYIDETAPPEETRYWIMEQTESSGTRWFGPVSVPSVEAFAGALSLGPSYPNPFNPTTTIPFVIPEAGGARLAVYDAQGRLVKKLVDTTEQRGDHKVSWNGRDDEGKEVASGIYFIRLEFRGRVRTQKIVLLK